MSTSRETSCGNTDRPIASRNAVLEATLLENGNILITIQRSCIYEPDRNKKIVWSHKDREASHDADRLPNGNTLGTAGDKVIEIAPDGTLLWQMLAPGGGNGPRKFHKAIRIGPDGKAYGG